MAKMPIRPEIDLDKVCRIVLKCKVARDFAFPTLQAQRRTPARGAICPCSLQTVTSSQEARSPEHAQRDL